MTFKYGFDYPSSVSLANASLHPVAFSSFQRLLCATGRNACRPPLAFLPQPVALRSGQPIGRLPFSLFLPHRLSQLVLKSANAFVGPVDHRQSGTGNHVAVDGQAFPLALAAIAAELQFQAVSARR